MAETAISSIFYHKMLRFCYFSPYNPDPCGGDSGDDEFEFDLDSCDSTVAVDDSEIETQSHHGQVQIEAQPGRGDRAHQVQQQQVQQVHTGIRDIAKPGDGTRSSCGTVKTSHFLHFFSERPILLYFQEVLLHL